VNTALLQQVTALAAVIQAATLVEQLARGGDIAAAESEALLQALGIQTPEPFKDVYSDPASRLSSG